MATNIKQQLKDLLIELFQLHNTDLDFGIYRILNLKAQEIENFISNQLDTKIEEVKAKIINRQNHDLKDELERLTHELETDFDPDFENIDAGALPMQLALKFEEKMRQYRKVKSDLELQQVSKDTERSIYNELYRFFERYYEEGDFISKPRAGRNNYMIPYEGEEVKLYWANYDQYYIKTGDNFKNYVFNNQASTPDTLTEIEFKIVDVEVSLNNNKEEKGRLFIPTEEPVEWMAEQRKLLLKFFYRVPTAEEKRTWGEKQSVKAENKGINQRFALHVTEKATAVADAELLRFLSKTRANSKGEAIPILLYHLDRYTAVNKFDYFVHKDLKGFLKRELDFFLKNEVLSIQFLNADWKEDEVQDAIKNNVLRASAIRDVALSVIEFIGELEDFQKRLFEKKKFVVQSDYCLTLDIIPQQVYDDVIISILTDPEQRQIKDWIELGFLEENELAPDAVAGREKKSGATYNSAIDYLNANKTLVLDTKNLTKEIKWELIKSIDNIDANTNGLVINSENWQALHLVSEKYKGRFQSCYFDPPYNTGGDFVYKDAYQESSWLSLIEGRLRLAKKLLHKSGTVGVSIDINELDKTVQLLDKFLGRENRKSIITIRRSSVSGAKVINPGVVNITEYLVIYSVNAEYWKHNKIFREKERDTRYSGFIKNINDHYSKWEYTTILEALAEYKNLAKSKLRKTLGEEYEKELETFIYDNSDSIFQPASLDDDSISEEAVKMKYKSAENPGVTMRLEREEKNDYYLINGKVLLFFKDRLIEVGGRKVFGELVADIWDDVLPNDIHNEGGVKLRKGKKPEKMLERYFDLTSDANDYVLDFFAGSGTTGGVAIKSQKKFVLVEMAEYFNKLTKPRLINTLYGEQSGISKNRNWQGGGMFQYIKLEQYEDSLNNIDFKKDVPQLSLLDQIRYQLTHATQGSDSLLNLEKFTRPFNYTMKIVQQNEPKDTVIDLVTTFNFLLGIDVIKYRIQLHQNLEYRIVEGKKGLQLYLIIWRTYDEATIDLTKERDWITAQPWYDLNAAVYCNGNNVFNAHPIEPEFIRLMTEPVL